MKVLALAAAIAVSMAQPVPPQFPPPASHPEAIADTRDFPYLPSPPGARLIESSRVDDALELKAADADDEAVLAGMSYLKKSYEPADGLTAAQFVMLYRDGLFAAGWKLIGSTKVDPLTSAEGLVSVAAHYMINGRNLYARVSRTPEGPVEIAVADVGSEDWTALLSSDCRLRIPSLHFDRDRPTLRVYESTPTLEKLAELLKMKSAPTVVIEGHADNVGEAGAAARQALSEQRARSVAAWLTSHGVPAARVTATGYGKMRPIADNDSDLGRALNRRIEVACLRR